MDCGEGFIWVLNKSDTDCRRGMGMRAAAVAQEGKPTHHRTKACELQSGARRLTKRILSISRLLTPNEIVMEIVGDKYYPLGELV